MMDADLHQRIRSRAYSLWEQEGWPDGRADEHWFRAEAEVAGVNSGGDAPPDTPGAGEHVCPGCEGTGLGGRKLCKECGGTGRIIDAPGPLQQKRERQQADPSPVGSPRTARKIRDNGGGRRELGSTRGHLEIRLS